MTGSIETVDDPESLRDQVKDVELIIRAMGKPLCANEQEEGDEVGMSEFTMWSENQGTAWSQGPVREQQVRG